MTDKATDSAEFPKMLVREGAEIEWEGHSLDTLIVTDAEGLAAAKKEGWGLASELKKPAAKK